ncbi:MAG: protein-L-isoaspartate(D-aspartate) O-methyltransferase [Desulfosarcina sp.]|nr:protein-L-isoaspartate(D-aspartate) O-methyltransferase [Desulfosarcina sp.]MBC2743650.1 protein-L-isoaspartate(D-aspartate) O-methyltransferase [Desulfosarcina sp.]MBC2766559.1 protein-L-isoaspartate(D-aspartate) O-methyltransferase [Desulfosarcina sp.]
MFVSWIISTTRGLLMLLAIAAVLSFGLTGTPADSFEHQRRQMVTRQLRARDIVDTHVLRAMETVPRHLFVPKDLRHLAYRDTPLPIGHGQTISQPYIVALMSQLLAVSKGQRILEIGTGSGYQAAVLAEMEAYVFTIEIIPELGRQAIKAIHPLGYGNIQVRIGDGYKGWPENAPFDAIIVTCAPSSIPEPLKNQLAEGGRMVIPVGEKSYQQLLLLTKQGGEIKQEKIVDVRFVPMVDKKGKAY